VSEMAPEPVLVWTVRCPTEPPTWHDTEAEADRQVNWLKTRDPSRQVTAFAYPVLVHPYPPDLEATA
jgi:hypothetical protein